MPGNNRVINERVDSSNPNGEVFNGKKDISKLAAGDTYYYARFIDDRDSRIFKKILEETDFDQMFNCSETNIEPIPRLVAGQCDKSKGKSCIYRMPGCNEKNIRTSNWSSTVKQVLDLANEEINQNFNHCVVTLFRNKDDSLGFHKDKLLDLTDKTHILSISFGDTRPIVFKSENGRHVQTIMLRPGSLLAIGPKTNKLYYHGISKVEDDVGPRLSLSFRSIASFVDEETNEITGQGDEYQDVNYPFLGNYSEHDFSEEQLSTMKEFNDKAKDQVKSIISNIQ